MKNYELVYVLRPTLDDEAKTAVLEKVKAIIETSGEVEVPVQLLGLAEGVKAGGKLSLETRKLKGFVHLIRGPGSSN